MDNTQKIDSAVNEFRNSGGRGSLVFLIFELLLFGGLFLLFVFSKMQNPGPYHLAALNLSASRGFLGLVLLITTSFSVAVALSAGKNGNLFLSLLLLTVSGLIGILFFLNQYVILDSALSSGTGFGFASIFNPANGAEQFNGLFLLITGLHLVQISAGVIVLFTLALLILNEKISAQNYVSLERGGRFWQFTVIIWVFLFPLFYLVS